MYPPRHHQDYDFAHAVEVMKLYPLATIISANGADCFSTHIPMLYKPQENGLGFLDGHIDKFNPQCALLDSRKIYAIFHGPDTYISPNTYTTTQLPTWNYIKVHIEGVSTVLHDPADVKQMFIQMTETYEGNKDPFVLAPDDPRLDRLVSYVVGFRIAITQWEGKFKLSQDKIPADRFNAREKLLAGDIAATREFVERVYPIEGF